MTQSHRYWLLIPACALLLLSCGRIDYDGRTANPDGGGAGGGPANFVCPGYSFNIATGNQGLETTCDGTFAFRVTASQDVTVTIGVSSDFFEPILSLSHGTCERDEILSLPATGSSASTTVSLEAAESIIGVISAGSGVCQRFVLSIEAS